MGLEEKLQDLINAGLDLINIGDIVGAQQIKTQLVTDLSAAASESSYAEFYFGTLAFVEEDYDTALIHMLKARKMLDEDNAANDFAHIVTLDLNIGQIYVGLQKYPAAVEYLERMLPLISEQAPIYPTILSYLGRSHFHLLHFEKAMFYLESALELGHISSNLFQYLGHLYSRTDTIKAIDNFTKMLEIEREKGSVDGIFSAYTNLAVQYQLAEEHVESNKYALESVKIKPNAEVLGLIGFNYYRLQDFEKALDFANRAISLEPNASPGYVIKAKALIEIGIYGAVEENLRKAQELAPDDEEANYTFSLYYAKVGNYAESIKSIVKSLSVIHQKKLLWPNLQMKYAMLLNSVMSGAQNPELVMHWLTDLFREEQYHHFIGSALSAFLKSGQALSTTQGKSALVDLLMKDPQFDVSALHEQYLTPFGVSSNPVYVNTKDTFLNQAFVIKTQPLQNSAKRIALQDEFATLRFMHRVFAQEKIGLECIPEAVFMYESPEKIYVVINRYQYVPLQDLSFGSNLERATEIRSALASLAKVHGAVTDELQEDGESKFFSTMDLGERHIVRVPYVNAIGELKTRLGMGKDHDKHSRLGMGSAGKHFFSVYEAGFNEPDVAFFLHNDFFPTNILQGGYLIDFERKSIGNPGLDLGMLLEAPLLNGLNPEQFIEYYLEELSEFYADPRLHDRIRASYPQMALHTSLMKIGTHLAQGQPDIARHYLQKSLQRMDGKLKDAFVAYVREANKPEFQEIL